MPNTAFILSHYELPHFTLLCLFSTVNFTHREPLSFHISADLICQTPHLPNRRQAPAATRWPSTGSPTFEQTSSSQTHSWDHIRLTTGKSSIYARVWGCNSPVKKGATASTVSCAVESRYNWDIENRISIREPSESIWAYTCRMIGLIPLIPDDGFGFQFWELTFCKGNKHVYMYS